MEAKMEKNNRRRGNECVIIEIDSQEKKDQRRLRGKKNIKKTDECSKSTRKWMVISQN